MQLALNHVTLANQMIATLFPTAPVCPALVHPTIAVRESTENKVR